MKRIRRTVRENDKNKDLSHRRRQGQTWTEHERDDMDNGDNRDRLQVADDDANDSPGTQKVTSRGTEHSLHESVICRKIDQISSLHRCRCVVRWRGRPCATCNASRGSDDTSSGGRERGAGSVGSRVASWNCIRTLTGEATRPPGDRSQLESSLSQSSAESELYAAVKTASEGLLVQSITKDMGISCGLNLHLDASATICLVIRRGLGKAKHVDMQNLWIQEASKAGRFVGTNVNPADLMAKPQAKPKIEQLTSIMGYEFVGIDADSLEG